MDPLPSWLQFIFTKYTLNSQINSVKRISISVENTCATPDKMQKISKMQIFARMHAQKSITRLYWISHYAKNGVLPFYSMPLLGTVVPVFSVLGFRSLPWFRALCTKNQIWIYVINLPGFSALLGFKALFYGDGQTDKVR